ncbi:uncharacterized protein LOC127266501 [Andrographis paniculata]|uniref:uncharacterized protein LOC127266501 n=1 Tax=Andrographis paniculata TaxID=175694 RepID=UPI0021E8328C|nr:uncharacterized protein LOC127266501 [Andrographis paniculata]
MKRDGYTDIAVKRLLWAAAKATTIPEFKRRMEEMKKASEDVFNWLANKSPDHWSRSHFSVYPRCDMLLNNTCESFNSFIMEARDKPIISMLEKIRNLLMVRMQLNREKAEKWDDTLCPKIMKIMKKMMDEASEFIPMRSDDWNFQITGSFDQYTVNVKDRTCSCRKWDLTDIPCKHAVSVIWCRGEDPLAYVHKCYFVSTYKKSYAYPILPLSGLDLWEKTVKEAPLPPVEKKNVGRPDEDLGGDVQNTVCFDASSQPSIRESDNLTMDIGDAPSTTRSCTRPRKRKTPTQATTTAPSNAKIRTSPRKKMASIKVQ